MRVAQQSGFARNKSEARYPHLWNGLVGAWSPHLNPRGGTKLWDLSGRQNHGTLTNMDPATDWVMSDGYGALDFDGSTNLVKVGSVVQFPLTVCLFMRSTVDPVGFYDAMFEQTEGDTYAGWWIAKSTNDGSGNKFAFILSGVAVYPFTTLMLTSTTDWFFVAVSVTGNNGTATGYLANMTTRADLKSESTSIGTMSGVINNTTIGSLRAFTATNTHTGQISDVLIYDRVLNGATINQLYQLGPGGWAERRRAPIGYVADVGGGGFQAAWARGSNRVISPGSY